MKLPPNRVGESFSKNRPLESASNQIDQTSLSNEDRERDLQPLRDIIEASLKNGGSFTDEDVSNAIESKSVAMREKDLPARLSTEDFRIAEEEDHG